MLGVTKSMRSPFSAIGWTSAASGGGAKQRLAELFVEGLAVAQAGQRVAVGHFQQLLLVGDLVADVADDAAVAP